MGFSFILGMVRDSTSLLARQFSLQRFANVICSTEICVLAVFSPSNFHIEGVSSDGTMSETGAYWARGTRLRTAMRVGRDPRQSPLFLL